ncbi:hypothetical protein OROHE_003636 [Orobanche hederae]
MFLHLQYLATTVVWNCGIFRQNGTSFRTYPAEHHHQTPLDNLQHNGYDIGKALDCMGKIETIMIGQDHLPYHYLMSSYGSAGKKKDVYRVWNSYKASFVNIPNVAYNTLISALVRVDDIEGAEELYNDWLSYMCM